MFSYGIIFADSYENTSVEKISITFESADPEESLNATKILSYLKTQKGTLFSQINFDTDLKNLSDKFDKITPQIKKENNQLYITLHLWPKRRIMNIMWKGNKIIKTKKLKKELGIYPGLFFTKNKFNNALNKVKDLYLKKGYFESDFSYNIENIDKKNEVIITIKINEGKGGKIQKIVFKGFTKEEKKNLKSLTILKKHNLLSWLNGSGIFQQEALDQDQMNIMNYLNNKGYADATIDINILDKKKYNGIILKINAHRGTLYHFGKITFSGNTKFSDAEIKQKLLIQSKDIFSFEQLRSSANELKELYGQKGYIDAQILQETSLLEKEPIYNVHFKIEEGERFKIGLIKVFGNKQTKINVILRESLLTPGKDFDLRRLKATQQRLEYMGYFKNVNVYPVKASEIPVNSLTKKTDLSNDSFQTKTELVKNDNVTTTPLNCKPDNYKKPDNYRDVYIELEETTTGSANLSAGISSTENVFGSLELLERNFNIKGFSNLFSQGPSALRGAGEYASAKAIIGKKERTYYLNWMDPYFRDSLWRFGSELSYTTSKLQSKTYNIKTYGGSIFTSYPLSNHWTVGLKYRIRHSITQLKNSANNNSLNKAINAISFENEKPLKNKISQLQKEYIDNEKKIKDDLKKIKNKKNSDESKQLKNELKELKKNHSKELTELQKELKPISKENSKKRDSLKKELNTASTIKKENVEKRTELKKAIEADIEKKISEGEEPSFTIDQYDEALDSMDITLQKELELEDLHGLISAVSSSLSFDSTDNPYKAHRGIRSSLEGEFSGIGGDFYFFKLSFVNSLYFPVWTKGTVKVRGDFKFVKPTCRTSKYEQIPSSERFFLGGESSVRGYKPYILGPRRIDDKDAPIGGISSSLFSVECAQELFSQMDAFVFFDAGNVSEKTFKIPNFKQFNASYGVGVRLKLGNKIPITLGYGFPINPTYSEDKRKFFFSMGGQF